MLASMPNAAGLDAAGSVCLIAAVCVEAAECNGAWFKWRILSTGSGHA